MKKLFIGTLVVVFALTVAPIAAAQQAQPAAPAKGAVAATTTLTYTVEALDLAKREITLKSQEGEVQTFYVDEAAKNLDQVKKGDVVTAKYTESLAYEVKKSTAAKPGIRTDAKIEGANKGEKPKGMATRTVAATVTITAIDAAAPSVTIKGPAGNSKTIKVKDPKKLEGVKVGDLIDITYTEVLSLSVAGAPKK
jgi:hypothetical protein